MSIGLPYRAESSIAILGHAVHTYASALYDVRESGVSSSRTAVMLVRPASETILSASCARSLRHWPVLLHTIITNLSADDAVWMAANLRLMRRSLCSDMSLISPVTGLSTITGFPAPKAAASGWKSPSPMYRKQSTSSETDSAAVQLQPRTCPGYAMRASPSPTSTSFPRDSSMRRASGIRSMYWMVARSPILPGSPDIVVSSSPLSAMSERASTYSTSGSSPMDGILECP